MGKLCKVGDETASKMGYFCGFYIRFLGCSDTSFSEAWKKIHGFNTTHLMRNLSLDANDDEKPMLPSWSQLQINCPPLFFYQTLFNPPGKDHKNPPENHRLKRCSFTAEGIYPRHPSPETNTSHLPSCAIQSSSPIHFQGLYIQAVGFRETGKLIWAIEHGPFWRYMSYWTWWFSIAMVSLPEGFLFVTLPT